MFDRADRIAIARTNSLARLAKAVEGDPATFFRGADFRGADLRGQNLQGFDLTEARFEGARVDYRTKVDEEFWPAAFASTIDSLTAALEFASSPFETVDILLELASLHAKLGSFDQMARAVDEIVTRDLPLPVRTDRILPLSPPFELAHAIVSKWLEWNAKESQAANHFQKLWRDSWWGEICYPVVRELLFAPRNTKRRPRVRANEVALLVASMGHNVRTTRGLLDEWTYREGTNPGALPVLTRCAVSRPWRSLTEKWAGSWLETNLSRKVEDEVHLRHILILIGRYDLIGKVEPIGLGFVDLTPVDTLFNNIQNESILADLIQAAMINMVFAKRPDEVLDKFAHSIVEMGLRHGLRYRRMSTRLGWQIIGDSFPIARMPT